MKVYQVVSYEKGNLTSYGKIYRSLGQARAFRTRKLAEHFQWFGRRWNHEASKHVDVEGYAAPIYGIQEAELDWKGVE
jgi:hypothetical protein